MSTLNLPSFSLRMCEVLSELLDTEYPYRTYANIIDDASDTEDHAFDAEVKALKAYFDRSVEHMKAIEQIAQQQKKQIQRITCENTGKLIATAGEQGVFVWCMYEKKPELITWETLDALRAKCQSVPTSDEHREAC